MTTFGYARVSTGDQDCAIQETALADAGCEIIRSEKKSGASLESRTELENLLTFIRDGDVLVVTRLDRLARSLDDLLKITARLREKGASLRAVEQPVDTSTAAGNAFFQMLGVFAEFERNLLRERQEEGIAKAKAEGRFAGRPPTVDADEVRRLKADGVKPVEIAKRLKIGRASVYRALGPQASAP